jgi:hypothetical protein
VTADRLAAVLAQEMAASGIESPGTAGTASTSAQRPDPLTMLSPSLG